MNEFTGQVIGNYRVVDRLGSGSHSTVYIGDHVYLHNKAAIIVKSRVFSAEDEEHFLEEAQLLASLDNPHIIRYLDFGVVDSNPFLVLDYAPGGNLRNRFPGGTRLPLELVLRYTRDVADALQYLHDRQIIHRDVKPENLLLGRDDGVLLGDFGIAIYADYADQANVAGTIPYMAPEQINGKPQFASDQYALGVVVYEWLSGGLPFHGDREEIVIQHLYATPPPLREQVPAISPAVEQVVLRTLAKNPEDRFPNVRAFAEALQEAFLLERATTINVDARRSFINLRIMEEPLTSLNVVRTLSALTELYTKCWLIYQGRFIDLIDYAQTHNVHFDIEANLIITKLHHNSPLDIKLDVSVEGIARAIEIALNAVIGIKGRKKEAELKNRALDEEIEQKKREAESDFEDKEQARQKEARRAWIEDQQALVDLEERRLKLRREQVEFEMGLVDYALDTSKRMVEILYPISDTETKAIAAQTLINNILQLGEGRRLELVQRASHKEIEMPEKSLLTSNNDEIEDIDTQTGW